MVGEQNRRIALFGGSFDPVHRGHLLVAHAAFEELNLSRLFFIPAAQSPFKPDSPLAPPEVRLRMLRLALAGETRFWVDDQELRRGGISYSIDTVQEYVRCYPGAEIYYLIGADHAAKLPQWRSSKELARLVTFLVIPRPGEPAPHLPPPFVGTPLRGFLIDLSSSEVKRRVAAGRPIHFLVPSAVAEAIHNNGLYF